MNVRQDSSSETHFPGLAASGMDGGWRRLGHHLVSAENKEVKVTPRAALDGICQIKVATEGRSLWLYGAEIEYPASKTRPLLTVLNVPPGACSPVIILPEPADAATTVTLFFVEATCGEGQTEVEIWGTSEEIADQSIPAAGPAV